MRHSTQQSQGTRNARFTGSLYQLFSNKPVDNGAYVAVNGPWDTYGVVTSSAPQAACSNSSSTRLRSAGS